MDGKRNSKSVFLNETFSKINYSLNASIRYRIPANYRKFVYCTAIRNGDDKEWEFASTQFDKELDSGQRNNLQNGMACTKQPWLINRYLVDQLNGSKVRLQDAAAGFSAIALNKFANSRAWTFFKDNWDEIFSK